MSELSLHQSPMGDLHSRSNDDPEWDEFVAEVRQVNTWWEQERWQRVKRNYKAEDVVRLRGPHDAECVPHSNIAAKKAWKMFKELQEKKDVSFTFGALDSVQVVQMSKYLSSIYVSGWQSSSTASTSNEPGPDVADYPMDTVPNKVDQLFRALMYHDRKQRNERMRMSAAERAKTPAVDFWRPIIADADTGHGGLTAVMKLTKMFIERGAAGVHLEDQKPGTKKCGHMGGKVLVSTQEHVDRLCAARLQADIMGTDTLIVARTDAEAATLLDNNWDSRDQPFIKGTTNPDLEAMVRILKGNESSEEVARKQKEWLAQANLCTYFEAIENAIKASDAHGSEDKLHRWQAEGKYLSNADARKLADELGFGDVYWDWDKPRTREGYYLIKPGVESCVQRAKAFAPYCDLLWMETAKPTLDEARHFAEGVQEDFPDALLAYNLSPSFNWDKAGMTDDEIGSFIKDLGKLGFVWQFITLAGFHADGMIIDQFAKNYAQRGMAAYVQDIQRVERKNGVEILTHQKWSGADYADQLIQTVTGGLSSTLAMGSGVTEKQFTQSDK